MGDAVIIVILNFRLEAIAFGFFPKPEKNETELALLLHHISLLAKCGPPPAGENAECRMRNAEC